MKIAMPNCALDALSWKEAFEFALKNDFDAYELNAYYPSIDLDCLDLEEVKDARTRAEAAGMEMVVHAPFFELNIAALARRIRETSVAYVKKSIDLCAAIGGQTLVVHSGNYTYSITEGPDLFSDPVTKLQWDTNIDSLKQINDYANSNGVVVCLENLGGFGSVDRSFEDLLAIREAVGESLKFTLDVGHARLNKNYGVEKGLKTLGEHIRHIHITDNHGETDDHMAIGDGDSDYSAVVEFAKDFPHVATLEVLELSADPAPILRSREYFCSLFGTP